MGSDDLCEVLYEKVFSWIGLPLKILGDQDARLRASQIRALCKYFGVRLMMSTYIIPKQTASRRTSTKRSCRCSRRLLTSTTATGKSVSLLYCMLVIILYTALLGFTPHHLLFGWTPQDLRVPFVAAELNDSDITRNVEGWVELRKEQLKRANINLEYTGLLW